MSQKFIIALSLVLLSLTAVACDRNTEIAGIDGATEVSALTEEQNDAFCGHLQANFNALQEDESFIKTGCMLGGVMSSIFAGAEDKEAQAEVCQTIFDQCMAEEREPNNNAGAKHCPDSEDLATCSATIAEVNTCIEGMLEWGLDSIKSIGSKTCADLVTEEGVARVEEVMDILPELEKGLPEIDACAPLREKCPDYS